MAINFPGLFTHDPILWSLEIIGSFDISESLIFLKISKFNVLGFKSSANEDIQQFLDSQNEPAGEKIEIPSNSDINDDEEEK